jgi:glycosyltransferase involved in cell wall biosynthesis
MSSGERKAKRKDGIAGGSHMRVLMLTPTYDPIIGGAETAVRNLAIGLNDVGIHTDVMTFNVDREWHPKWSGRTEISHDGFQVFWIPALDWSPLIRSSRMTMGINLIPGRFRNLLSAYDILHYHVGDWSFPLFSFLMQKTKICQLHGWNYYLLGRNFLGRFFLKHAVDMYLTPTEEMKNGLARVGVPEARITCLPNGVDVEAFRPAGRKEDNLVLFVGRIDSNKGPHILLNSLDHLKNPVRLVIIGPPGWDLKYFNHMLRLMEKTNLKGKHKVDYIGEKSHRDIVEWYQRASIFVFPTVMYEALGIVSLEALACETPVVATNVGGIPEVVHDGENGMLVEPNSAVKLANAIQYLLDNESIRKKFGEEGRKLVVEDFSTKAVMRKLVKIYEHALGARSWT